MKKLLYLSVISLGLAGCAKHYTPATHSQLLTTGIDLEKVQFYNSARIVLEREVSQSETKTVRGVLQQYRGKYYDQIIVPRKTMGKCVAYTDSTLTISFDPAEPGGLVFMDNSGYSQPMTLKSTAQANSYFQEGGGWYLNYGGQKYLMLHPHRPAGTHYFLDDMGLISGIKYKMAEKTEETRKKKKLKGYQVN